MTLLLPTFAVSQRLSERLLELKRQTEKGPVRFDELLLRLQGNAYLLLLLLLALPFVTPIPLSGLSTPFGLAIAAISLRLSFGRKPWLPGFLAKKEVPRGFFGKVLAVSSRLVSWLEAFLKPRWAWLFSRSAFVSVHALLVFASSLLLMLPLPIPFSNMFPAWVILFIVGGLLAKDGVAIMLGYATALACAGYFVFLGGAARQLLKSLTASGGWSGFFGG